MTMTTLDDIPCTVLAKILTLVVSQGEVGGGRMKGLSTVSPKWKYVISQIPLENPTIVDVDLGEGFFTPDDFELYKFKRISILHLFFRRDYPELRHPKSLEVLDFQNAPLLTLQNYNRLVHSLSSLRILTFPSTLTGFFEHSEAWTQFPQLESLRILSARYENTRLLNGKETLSSLNGIIGFMNKVNFSKLSTFCLDSPYHPSREIPFMDSWLTFLVRHQNSLRTHEVKMSLDSEIGPEELTEDKRDFWHWTSIPNVDSRLGALNLDLTCFEAEFCPYQHSENFLRIIDRVTSIQNSLSVSLVLLPRFTRFPSEFIQVNCGTLTELALNIRIVGKLDCKVFENCANLRKLILHAPPKILKHFETKNYNGIRAKSEIVHLDALPKTLSLLQVINFFLEAKDTLIFTKGTFPALESLSLLGIGEKDFLGMTLDNFLRLASEGIEVGVYRGFNKNSVKSTLRSGNSDLTFLTLGLLYNESSPQPRNISSLAYYKPSWSGPVFEPCTRSFSFRCLGFAADGYPEDPRSPRGRFNVIDGQID